MRKFSRKTIKVLSVISMILSIALLIFFVSMKYFSGFSVGQIIIIFLVSLLLLPFMFMGLLLNWKKILIGLIAPIPVLSYFIEYFKGVIYAAKAFISLLKKQDVFIIGQPEEIVEDDEE